MATRKQQPLVRQRTFSKGYLLGILLTFSIGLLLSLARWGNLLYTWRISSTDFLHGYSSPGHEIIIVAIDDTSIAQLGPWPWPHFLHAQLIGELAQAHTVGMDILFEEINSSSLPETSSRSNNVIFALLGVLTENSGPGIVQAQTIILPPSELQSAAAGLGSANVLPDPDGVVRRVPLLLEHDTLVVEAMSLQILRHFLDMPPDPPGKLENGYINAGSLHIPVDQWGRMTINFAGEPNTFPQVSYVDVLSGEISPNTFHDKIVLIGQMNLTGGWDLHSFPTTQRGEKMAGVEIQANIIHTILHNRFSREQPLEYDIAVILSFALLISFILPRTKTFWSLLVVLLLGGGYWLYAFFAFDQGLTLDLIYPTLSLGLSYIAVMVVQFTHERSNRRHVTELFSRYVPPAVVNEIIVNSEKMELSAAREQEITVLITDIRNFTSFTEKTPPRQAVETLNACLNSMTKAVFAYGGTVDKFTGDGMMALFNAPLPQLHHTLQAVRAALRMQNQILDSDTPVDAISLHYGIGIHTGKAIVGNIGSQQRLEYTAIGDTVNLAARLQKMAKGGQILISKGAYGYVKKWVKVEEVGEFQVKGRQEVVMVYEVISISASPETS